MVPRAADRQPAEGQPRAESSAVGPAGLPSLCLVGVTAGVLHMLTDTPGEDRERLAAAWASYGVGGAERQLATLGRLLRQRGWPVTFLVGDWGQRTAETAEGIRLVAGYKYPVGIKGLRFYYPLLPMFWSALRRADADIYLARGVTPWSGLTAAFCHRHGRRFVQALASNRDVTPGEAHGGYRDRWLRQWALRWADAVVAQHEQQAALLSTHFRRQAQVIRNIVPSVEEISSAEGEVEPVVLWIGSFKVRKRLDWCVAVAQQVPEARFVVIGGPTQEEDRPWQDWLAEQAVQVHNLECVGRVPHDQMTHYYRQAAVVLHTSETDSEGFPNVLLEAWNHGVPTVTSCSPAGVVEREGLGAYCKTVSEMVPAVRRYVQASAQERQELADRARGYLAQYHRPEQVVAAYADILTALGSA